MSKGNSYSVTTSQEGESNNSADALNPDVNTARVVDYKTLAARQWQFAENLYAKTQIAGAFPLKMCISSRVRVPVNGIPDTISSLAHLARDT